MVKIRRILSVIICVAVIVSLFPLTVLAAKYTSCKSGTVSWNMIYDNPKTYYWLDSEDEYCALTAVKSGKYYYVTLYRSKKGDEIRYLKQNKDDDSSSKKEWDSAKAVYTGGTLYKKASDGSSGNDDPVVATVADGTYTATSNSTYKKDGETYSATVNITVSGGKITALTATGPVSSSDNKSYFNKALSGIKSQLIGQTAQKNIGDKVDAVSKATNSSRLIKEAVNSALDKAQSGGGESPKTYTVTWKNYDGTVLETDKNVAEGTKPSYDGNVPVKNSDSQYAYSFSGWALSSYQTSGTAASNLPKVSGNVTYYAAFEKMKLVSVTDGLYGDNSAAVQRFGYVPVITVTVKNGIVTALTAVADTNDNNLGFLEEALDGLQTKLIGQSVSAAIALDEESDAVSGATFASKAVISDIKSALAQSPKGNCTIVWKNDDGSILKTDTVAYGTETVLYNAIPEKEDDDSYTYTFKGWTPSASKFVTGNAVYTAEYNASEKETPVSVLADGKYIDGTGYVSYGYTPVVKITVKDGKILAIDVTSKDVGSNGYFLNTANTWIKSQLEGKTADDKLLDGIDAVSGATATKKTVMESVTKALHAENVIKWEDDSGNILDNAKVTYGTMPEYDGEQPSKQDCNFTGWIPEIHSVSGDETYTAVFEEKLKEYTVSYDSISGIQTAKSGDTVHVLSDIPVKDGYKFDGWSLDGRKLTGNTFVMPSRNVNLKALWKEWHDEGIYGDDSIIDSILYTYNIIVSVSVNDNNQITDIIADTDEDKETLEYFGFYESLEYVKEQLVYEDISEENLERVYYASNVELGGDAPVFASDIVAGVMQALQNPPKELHTITVKNDDGSIFRTYNNIPYGTRTEDIIEIPEKQSDEKYTHTFEGWQEDVSRFVTENAVYTARFNTKVNKFVVTWKDDDGNILKKDIAEYGDMPVYGNNEPEKSADEYCCYVFKGWNKALSPVTENVEYTAVFQKIVKKSLSNDSAILTKENKLGIPVRIKALASGGEGGYKYAVYYKRTSNSAWTTCSSWTEETDFSISPIAAVKYDICVKVKDKSGTVSKKYFTVNIENTFKNISSVSAESIDSGESVYVKAAAVGGLGDYQYAVYYKRAASSKWTTVSSWTDKSDFVITPISVNGYNICVKIKDKNGVIVKKYFDLMVKDVSLKNLSEISAETLTVGETVTFTAIAKDGQPDYQYAFYYKKTENTAWKTLSNWSGNSIQKLSFKETGTYNTCIKVKDSSGTIKKKYFVITVN